MAELKKYTSFEALKLEDRVDNNNRPKKYIFSEFEAFVKRLYTEYSNKKKLKTDNGKQPNR